MTSARAADLPECHGLADVERLDFLQAGAATRIDRGGAP